MKSSNPKILENMRTYEISRYAYLFAVAVFERRNSAASLVH